MVFKNKKIMQKTLKSICINEVWPQEIFLGSLSYFNQFSNWRIMLKQRPMLRFDGIYTCKMHYVRFGMAETSQYRPFHDVYTYKYLKFYQDGSMVSVYTIKTDIFELFMNQNNLFEIINEVK